MERKIYERDRHDGDAVACLLAPQNLAAPGVNTPAVSMQGFDQVLFCILGGDASDNAAVLNAVVEQCNTAGGGGAKPLAGLLGTKAITAATSGLDFSVQNDKWLLHVRTEEMDVDAGFNWLRLAITISAQDTWYLAVEAVRSTASYEPVATTNITQVVP